MQDSSVDTNKSLPRFSPTNSIVHFFAQVLRSSSELPALLRSWYRDVHFFGLTQPFLTLVCKYILEYILVTP